MSQLVGFVVLDNGIAMVAFLTSDGVPLTVELGVSLDVLLVVADPARAHRPDAHVVGGDDLDDLTELRD